MHSEMRHIYVERFGNVSRIAADIDLANNLFEHAFLITHTYWFTLQVYRYRDLNLLARDQPAKISVHQSHANGIDLSIVKHDFTGAYSFDLQTENGVATAIGPQNRRQFTQG